MKRFFQTNRPTLPPSLAAVVMAGVLACGGCRDQATGPRTPINVEPFREMARASGCADVRNRLFLIDERLVFWDRAGNCADAAYAQVLFSDSVDHQLCHLQDSIAGPMRGCGDARYASMFDTITANADKPDLGLGPDHRVRAIPL